MNWLSGSLFCSCSACRSDLFEFFHPPFFYRHSMVVIRACHHCLLANMGYIRGEWSSLPYAARTFFCTHRIFYMDSGKYRYVFGAWKYPNQIDTWSLVHLGKVSSWLLLVIVSFLIVASLKQVKEQSPTKAEMDESFS